MANEEELTVRRLSERRGKLRTLQYETVKTTSDAPAKAVAQVGADLRYRSIIKEGL